MNWVSLVGQILLQYLRLKTVEAEDSEDRRLDKLDSQLTYLNNEIVKYTHAGDLVAVKLLSKRKRRLSEQRKRLFAKTS